MIDAYRLKSYFPDGTQEFDRFDGAVALELVPQIVGLQNIYVELDGKKPIFYIRREFATAAGDNFEPVPTGVTYFIGYEDSPKKLLSVKVSAEINEIEDDPLR